MDIQKIFKKAEAAYTASLRAIEKNINSEKEKIITWDAEISDLRKKYDECLLSDAPEEAQTIEIRIKQLKAKIQQSKRLIELNKKTLEDRNPVEAKKLIDLGRELLKNDPFEAEFKPVQAAIKNLIGKVQAFAENRRKRAKIYRECTRLMARIGRFDEVSKFPKSHGYSPEMILKKIKLPPAVQMHQDVPKHLIKGFRAAPDYSHLADGLAMTSVEISGSVFNDEISLGEARGPQAPPRQPVWDLEKALG